MLKLHQKDRCFTLLFDTGPEEGLVIENAKRMGVDLKQVDAIVISHGHFDHYGGTLSVLKEIGKKDLPVYAHPEVFLPRAFKKKKLITISHLITPKDVEKAGGKVITSRDATPLWEDSVILTGEVPRKTAYEQGAPGEHRLVEGCWESTPDIIDERCLVFELEGKGLCVLTGCGHTGVVNAARHAIETTGKEKIHMVMGGFHLAGNVFHDRIEPTVADLEELNPDYIITGHCTGRAAQSALTQTFGDRHIPYGVGTVFRL